MSVYSIDNFAPVVAEGDALDIWGAYYVGIEKLPASSTIIVSSEWSANLPGLAAVYLGSKYLWWVLLVYNGLFDPIKDVAPGVTLRIPDRDMLMTYMEQKRTERASAGSSLAAATTII